MTQTIPETPPEYDRTRIIERPNGFYWQSKDGGKDYGPFATLLEAVQDMQYGDEASSYEPGETVEEARPRSGSRTGPTPTPVFPPRRTGRGRRSTDPLMRAVQLA